jgi:hypothetical protein
MKPVRRHTDPPKKKSSKADALGVTQEQYNKIKEEVIAYYNPQHSGMNRGPNKALQEQRLKGQSYGKAIEEGIAVKVKSFRSQADKGRSTKKHTPSIRVKKSKI